ncbi:MAG: hypothetical protein QOJ20_4977 [Mycobacterium sp.]|nr:hypothetical protein [Mycobacterium sp.]
MQAWAVWTRRQGRLDARVDAVADQYIILVTIAAEQFIDRRSVDQDRSQSDGDLFVDGHSLGIGRVRQAHRPRVVRADEAMILEDYPKLGGLCG